MSYTKTYIGKGKKVANLDIIALSINMEEAEQFIFEYEGKRYLKLEVAALKQADKFGRTHTAYVSERQSQTHTANEPKTTTKTKRGRKPKTA